jgi:hypothetical protein
MITQQMMNKSQMPNALTPQQQQQQVTKTRIRLLNQESNTNSL